MLYRAVGALASFSHIGTILYQANFHAFAARAAADAVAPACTNATEDGRCHVIQRDHLLVQIERSHLMATSQQRQQLATKAACDGAQIRRRRREKDMCACRRRNGPSNGWTCAEDVVVSEESNLPPPPPVACSSESEISRRRREGNMCSCRRRSGPRDGWKCEANMVVVDESYVPPATLPTVESSASSIKVMSYNVMGWSACGRRRRRNLPSRGQVITEKIRAWDPAVLGAQEVETGGGTGSKDCEDALVANTDLNSGLYKEDVLESLGSSWTNLKGGYWMTGARYKHKKSGAEFLLFNSHWKHGYGLEQAKIAAAAIDGERKKYSSLPTLFMGDTNQFCKGYESDAYKYLTGQLGSSPVKFVDVHSGDWGGSFGNGDCRIDFMFASVDQWSLVDASIDRKGMNGAASDHAALMAELVPQSR